MPKQQSLRASRPQRQVWSAAGWPPHPRLACGRRPGLAPTILDKKRPPLVAAHSSHGPAGAGPQGDEGGQAGVRAGAGSIISYFRASPEPYTLSHSTQRAFVKKQVYMITSTPSPQSLVADPAYVAMIAIANPHLSTMSRSTRSPATSSRFREL